jgi:uncharacterized integral membrane protein
MASDDFVPAGGAADAAYTSNTTLSPVSTFFIIAAIIVGLLLTIAGITMKVRSSRRKVERDGKVPDPSS